MKLARERRPGEVAVLDSDWLIVTSHDCDIANYSIEKEPVVEVLRAEALENTSPDKQQAWGRNPRVLELAGEDADTRFVLRCRVHERWTIPRQLLLNEAPAERRLSDKDRRLVAEWLAKRYIRSAFPTAFDARWRSKLREWTKLLETHSRWIQGVYLRLHTLKELEEKQPYRCALMLAVPIEARQAADWKRKRQELERAIEGFWEQFVPAIQCVEVVVRGTDDISLADLEPYQRFDADWVSFADDSPSTVPTADMTR